MRTNFSTINLFAFLLLGACNSRTSPPDDALPPDSAAPQGAESTLRAPTAVANAPVAPEAIYVGFDASASGVAVIDCNGFGQGTGDPLTSRFPFNPNVGSLGGVTPLLTPGTSMLDGGGAGALTWTADMAGGRQLGDSVMLAEVTALVLGQPLDLMFHNEAINVNAQESNHANPRTAMQQAGNCIESAPHPNPPRLLSATPNPLTGIAGEEPTVTSSFGPPNELLAATPPCAPAALNLLVPGDPFSSQVGVLGVFGSNHPQVFVGPQPPPSSPPPPPPYCPYAVRQQIGHFMYALDPAGDQVLVLNSNRMTVLAQIAMPDPVAMAISPDLGLLAVTDRATRSVKFIDTNPRSATFHQIVATTRVGRDPGALAWQPEGEALLVCNELSGSVSILDGATLQVTRTLQRFVQSPQGIAVSARQDGLGLGTGSYYAFIRNGSGVVVAYESATPTGGGLDDVMVPRSVVRLFGAASMQIDMSSIVPAFWVGHRDNGGAAAISRFELGLRGSRASLRRTQQIGGMGSSLAGLSIVDIAFDDIINRGALPDRRPTAVAPNAIQHSHKGIVKLDGASPLVAHEPMMLFVAFDDTGKVEVIDLATGASMQVLDAPGVSCLGNYFQQ